ncbi:ankyrin repeat domain-containing protein 45 [Elysia marginata]|uniref:Ankyrin repeat domain-containing protein 45 n=1 Tax=Elysia marginata TaxID=1093978 RepID=A0AAV4E9Z5_9GAST|nr:ankyrin repeat domain-containing protein 45 [Elysia marginata]
MTLEKSETEIDKSSRLSDQESSSKASFSRAGTEIDAVGGHETGHVEEEGPEIEQLLPNTNIVTHCIYKNDPQRLIRCFEDDQDPHKEEILELLNERDENGKSPLDLAACLGRNQLTMELLQRGADVNSVTKKGYSCLHYAALWGRMPVVKMLIEHGADLQQRNAHGERPREAAVRYCQDECIDFLDWAEAKTILQESIRHTLETVTDADKAVAGRMTKEEKTVTLNMCKEKQEWLDNTEDATTEDFIAQRVAFIDVVGPVVQKLLEPDLASTF